MKKVISILITAAALVSVCIGSVCSTGNTLPFKDVKSSAWYYDEICAVYGAGIMNGKSADRFKPLADMTRAELVTVLCRLSGDDPTGMGEKLTFTDTKRKAWYSDSVAWAVECGMVTGYEDNTFKPNKPVIRQELAKLLVEFLEYKNVVIEGEALIDRFADSLMFRKWVSRYIDTLRQWGIMGGDENGNFNPMNTASRAEIATVISRLLPEFESETVIFENGKTDFTIVYDDSDIELTRLVIDLRSRLSLDRGVNIKAVRASSAEDDYGREIVIGFAREKGRQVADSLSRENDFKMCFVGDDLVLGVSDTSLYPYLVKAFELEILSKITDRSLSLDKGYEYVHSETEHFGESYEQYLVNALRTGSDITSKELMYLMKPVETTDSRLNYRIYVPADYDPSKEYPVLFILHGSGERGDDNVSQLRNMVLGMFCQNNALLTSAIVVCPQCTYEDGWWSTDSLMSLLYDVRSQYSTDKDRYYVVGLSMGGYASWDLVTEYPDVFAAAVPICGGGNVSLASRLVDVPLYVVHGAKDDTVPVSSSRNMVNAIRGLGGTKVIYEELPNGGHNVWGYAANKAEITEWLFSQKLSDR